jgi:hypothetical protein
MGLSQVFLLSPARCDGRRAAMLLRPEARSPAADRLRAGTLTLGDAFAFMSALYFRGKLAYARAFATGAESGPTSYIITPTRGLQTPDSLVSIALLEEFASTDIASGDTAYRAPLDRDLALLAATLSATTRVILLGSIASNKYVDALAPVLGERLYYPASFIGRGDMSRGGLLLRSAAAGVELDYARLDTTVARRGVRPPKLEPAPTRRR